MNDLSQSTSGQCTVLVTGAAGYIGSHTSMELLRQGYDVVAVDNHCNSLPSVYEKVQQLAGRKLLHEKLDVRDESALANLLTRYSIGACIHFAGLKSVGDSMRFPLAYWDNNVTGLLTVLRALERAKVRRLVFSSSATVYGAPDFSPVPEAAPLRPASVYGQTKLAGEKILQALVDESLPWSVVSLRYFNPIGAHPSGLIGEAPQGVPNNLMPYIVQVASGKRSTLPIFGDDYPSPDGTCIRDYIHIQDLAAGHVAALRYLLNKSGSFTFNLGTGYGTSVRELVSTFERVNNVPVPSTVVGRRVGDVPEYFADTSLARTALGWWALHGIEDMCRDAWRWQLQSPEGHA